MSLFKKIFKKPTPETMDAEEALKELRVHSRYDIKEGNHFGININGKIRPFLNLSYGGFSVSNSELDGFDDNGAEIVVLDETCKAKFNRVHKTEVSSGFSFIHDTPDLLLYLRNKIEFLRMGSSMRLLDRTKMKEPYNQEGWFCYHGEGPCDAHFKEGMKDPDGLMVFMVSGPYAQVQFKGNKITTGYSDAVTSGQNYSLIRETSSADKELLKFAFLILTGSLSVRECPIIRSYMSLIEEEMRQSEAAA